MSEIEPSQDPTDSEQSSASTKNISVVLAAAGFFCGVLVTLSFLSGDEQGRVNLLYLLFLFAFLPLLGLLLSLVYLFRRTGKGFSAWLLALPVWPNSWARQLIFLGQGQLPKAWFFLQTQLIALSLGIGSLLAFVVILLGSDVSFVWRSTLLQAPDLLPLLQAVALPWSFWAAAQPSLELLQQSQDFRLGTQLNDSRLLGQWWKFAMAAQITFTLLPRALLLLFSTANYRRKLVRRRSERTQQDEHREVMNHSSKPGKLAEIVNALDTEHLLVNVAMAPEFCLQKLQTRDLPLVLTAAFGRDLEIDSSEAAVLDGKYIAVAVKSWEPPMGELKDYLDSLGKIGVQGGVLIPLDWDEQNLLGVKDRHFLEWRRFAGTLQGWSVLDVGDEQ